MTSIDGLNIYSSDNKFYQKDEFLEYYQKHRPPGSIPEGYSFCNYSKMYQGTASLPGSLYGEVNEGSPFSKYRQNNEATHDSTLSPANSITEDDDYETTKSGNFAWSTSSQTSFGSGAGGQNITFTATSAPNTSKPQQRKPLDRKTWYAKFLNSLKRNGSKKKGLPPSGHSLDTAKHRYQQIDRGGTGASGIYRSESCRQISGGSEYEYGSCHSSFDEPLSGMLNDKMKFVNNGWYNNNGVNRNHPSYSRSKGLLPTGDSFDNDSQSRDSGNSSAGTSTHNNTPHGNIVNAYRGRLPNLPQENRVPQTSDIFDRDRLPRGDAYAYSSSVNDAASINNSIYSYTTARAQEDNDSAVGSSSTLSHYNGNWYGKRYNSHSTTYDSISVASGSMANGPMNDSTLHDDRSTYEYSNSIATPLWNQQSEENILRQRRNPSLSWIASSSASGTFYSAKTKRKLDCLDEDDTSSFEVESVLETDQQSKAPSSKRQCSPLKTHLTCNLNDRAEESNLFLIFKQILRFLLLLLKFGLMAFTVLIIILGMFYIMRTYTCNLARSSKIDLPHLDKELNNNVFGQQYAISSITSALETYEKLEKPTVSVLLLLGSPGTGKTLTSSLIRQHFPVANSNSYFFSVPMHFNNYGLKNGNVDILWDVASHIQRNCGHSLVLFDDLEESHEGNKALVQNQTMEKIVQFASNLKNNIYGKTFSSVITQSQSTSSNGTIIVISSTAGGKEINRQTVEMTRDSPVGSIPQASDLDIERVVKSSPLIQTFHDMLISRGVTTSIIPFMPLSRSVVRRCIMNDIKNRFPDEHDIAPSRKIIDNLLQELKYFSDEFPVFSTSGCKTVSSKLDVLLEETPIP